MTCLCSITKSSNKHCKYQLKAQTMVVNLLRNAQHFTIFKNPIDSWKLPAFYYILHCTT